MQPTEAESPSLFSKRSTTPWDSHYHAVGLTLPRRGTHTTTPWDSRCCAATLTLASLLLLLMSLAFTSCDDRSSLLPPSGGLLYEVLLVGDKDDIVKTALQEDVPGLPQSEPQFDVSSIGENRFNQSVSMARNVVIVNINPQLYSSLRLRREKDVWAQPQMVVHVNAPSLKMLRDSIGRIAPTMRSLLNRSEMNKSIVLLRQKRNIKAEKLVRQMFGIEMWVPFDMTSSKQGKNFLWLSNNSPTMMKNIVIYKGSDSILQANIKGETDSMHFQNVAQTVFTATEFKNIAVSRGLWEMAGDDMGGPFVRRSTAEANVEAFVFAPGKKKRNAIKQLEAALYTIKY